MDYRIAICDDAEADRKSIDCMVRRWAEALGCSVQINGFPSAESFLFAYAEDKDYDILLLDVEMRGLSGIDLAKRIRADRGRAEIIFITSHFEFIAEGYEVDALHYLMKPLSEQKLFEVLSRAAKRLAVEPPSVIIHFDGETVKLPEADILYIESFSHYLEIHTRSKTPKIHTRSKTPEIHTRSDIYRIRENLSALEERLSGDFYRAHRSYLINLKAVERIGRTTVTLEGGAVIPLARGKYDAINQAFIERN